MKKKTDYARAGEILRALGHPARLQILAGLLKNECNVAQIQKKLRLPQSTISQHLATLRNLGIIEARREGTKRCYTVIDKKAKEIIEMIVQ
jgi:DNA-binding transcriptional ArsR family regulator